MVRMVSLSEEAYAALSTIKGKNSFSKVVLRLMTVKERPRKPLTAFAGTWKDNAEAFNQVLADRQKARLREVRF